MVDRREKYGIFPHFLTDSFVVTRENMHPRDVKTCEMCGEFVVESGYLECGREESLRNVVTHQVVQRGYREGTYCYVGVLLELFV
jgi:hypothetical protein